MRVDFYILQGEASRELMACRLCEKAYQQGISVFVLAQSANHVQQIDDLLWTFNDGGFVPHQSATQDTIELNGKLITMIGHELPSDHSYSMLINLSDSVPEGHVCCERIAEIVNQNETVKELGRKRFTQYRDKLYDLHHHEI